jgi:TonB family protein
MAVCFTTAWIAALAATCAAQSIDPRALLQAVSAAEQSADGWHAEGIEAHELTGEGMNIRTQQRFSATIKDATHMRWETAGDLSTLTVCDGTEHWNYTPGGVGFHISTVEATPCPSPLPRFDNLLENLSTVTTMGTESAQFEGGAQNCMVVKAEYKSPERRGAGGVAAAMIRTMCVDTERKLVLRERAENWNIGSNARSVRTTTFSQYERSADRVANAFSFEVPTGTFLDPGPQAGEGTGAATDGSHRFGDGVISPVVIVKVEPSTTDDARTAGVGGLVLVSLTVDAEGMPKNVAVERRLGYGLDEKAVEAVSQWRFKPGLSFGMPVVVRDLVVAVDFRSQ